MDVTVITVRILQEQAFRDSDRFNYIEEIRLSSTRGGSRHIEMLRPKTIGQELVQRCLPHTTLAHSGLRIIYLIFRLWVVTRDEQNRHIQHAEFSDDLPTDSTR